MALPTLFPEYAKTFKGLVRTLVSKIDGSESEPQYLFRSMFKKRFEPTMKWETLLSEGSIAAADVVSVDSKLPLKMRDKISGASGDIPKSGVKYQLREGEMTNIDFMSASNSNGQYTGAILSALFGDTKKVIHGVWARMEWMALQGLSTGIINVGSGNNVGKTHRVEYAIPAAQKLGAATIWSNVASTPLGDIEGVQNAAIEKGVNLRYILMDRATFNNLRKTTQVKARYAAFLDISATDVITPGLAKVNNLLSEDFGLQIVIVSSYVNIEIDGVKTATSCWDAGKVTFLTDLTPGTLHWGNSAESRRPVAGVNYAKADEYILVSKFSENEPLAEFTSSQAYAIPILNDPASVFLLDSAATSWS